MIKSPISNRAFGSALRATVAVAVVAVLAGAPSALGYGVLRDWLPTSAPPLDLVDHAASNIVLPLSGMAIALFVGWVWPKLDAVQASGLPPGRLCMMWLWLLRVVIPGTIALVMVRGLGLI